jgi:hypothetical protein
MGCDNIGTICNYFRVLGFGVCTVQDKFWSRVAMDHSLPGPAETTCSLAGLHLFSTSYGSILAVWTTFFRSTRGRPTDANTPVVSSHLRVPRVTAQHMREATSALVPSPIGWRSLTTGPV